MREHVPPVSIAKFCGAVLFGWLYHYVAFLAVDAYVGIYVAEIIACFACAIGVWMVAELGHQKGNLMYGFGGALASVPIVLSFGLMHCFYAAVGAASVVFYFRAWKENNNYLKAKEVDGCCKRSFIAVAAVFFFYFLVCIGIYNHLSIQVEGETLLLRDHIHNVLNSPAWTHFTLALWEMFYFFQEHGFHETWTKFVDSLDVQGENRSYQVLGLDSSASLDDIRSACRKLRLEWHPDKNPDKQAEAQEMFLKIQDACKVLIDLYERRSQKSEDATDSKPSNEETQPHQRSKTEKYTSNNQHSETKRTSENAPIFGVKPNEPNVKVNKDSKTKSHNENAKKEQATQEKKPQKDVPKKAESKKSKVQ